MMGCSQKHSFSITALKEIPSPHEAGNEGFSRAHAVDPMVPHIYLLFKDYEVKYPWSPEAPWPSP